LSDVSSLPVIVLKQKSVGVAVLLAFLFGPLGMLYSTGLGALVMFLFNIVVIPATCGFGLLITIPFCMMWAGSAAASHNKRQREVAIRRRMQTKLEAERLVQEAHQSRQRPSTPSQHRFASRLNGSSRRPL
jgi:hypothetical protein